MAAKPISIVASVFVANALLAASPAWSQKHVQSTLDSRVVLAYKANPGEVQRWLPNPWQSSPVASGPSKDANLVVTFVDRLLDQDAQGKPTATPSYRVVALAVPALNPQTGVAGPLLVRLYNSNPDAVPGFYKTAVLAAVEREFSSTGVGTSLGMASERWTMKDDKGGMLELQLQYQRGTPVRGTAEAKPRSGIDPATWRTYRIEQGTDVLKSIPTGVDRMKSFGFKTNVAELQKLFDGSEQLVSVTAIPWYTRQTFLPSD
jgi:hypothetical protein